jgi:hypothetical protein
VSHKDIFEDNPNVHVCTIAEAGVPNYHGTGTQRALYKKLLNDFKSEGKYDWVAFIDVDEFIMFDDDYDLEKLCSEFLDCTGIWLAWKMYNANGHIKRPVGSVIENYQNHLRKSRTTWLTRQRTGQCGIKSLWLISTLRSIGATSTR